MKKISVLLAMVMLVLAVPAFAGGEKCSADAQTCLNHWGAKKDMGWAGLEYDKSSVNVVTVKAITPGSPAAKAGFQVGDVLVALNGASFADKEALKKAKGEWKIGQAITYTVKRKGYDKQLTATLTRMPEQVFASMVGSHMLENHMVTTTAAAPEGQSTTTGEKADK